VAVSSTNAVSYSLSGAPSGMSINSAGVVSWATPVVGSYSVAVTAKDSVNGLSGSGVYNVVISAASSTTTTPTPSKSTPPVITATTLTGVAGKALTGSIAVKVSVSGGVSLNISGVPLGMSFAASGLNVLVSWPSPVAGTYTLKMTATDSAGASTTASIPVIIAKR
jgi:hypothetical protein